MSNFFKSAFSDRLFNQFTLDSLALLLLGPKHLRHLILLLKGQLQLRQVLRHSQGPAHVVISQSLIARHGVVKRRHTVVVLVRTNATHPQAGKGQGTLALRIAVSKSINSTAPNRPPER